MAQQLATLRSVAAYAGVTRYAEQHTGEAAATAYLALGHAYLLDGRYTEAESSFRKSRQAGKDLETEEGTVPRDLADWAPDPEQNYSQSELAEILRKTIRGLPQGFRIVFVLRDVEGLSTEETAETLGLSVPAVKSRLLRARLQLRERLSRYFRKKTGPRKTGVEK